MITLDNAICRRDTLLTATVTGIDDSGSVQTQCYYELLRNPSIAWDWECEEDSAADQLRQYHGNQGRGRQYQYHVNYSGVPVAELGIGLPDPTGYHIPRTVLTDAIELCASVEAALDDRNLDGPEWQLSRLGHYDIDDDTTSWIYEGHAPIWNRVPKLPGVLSYPVEREYWREVV